ncbi:MAG: sigma-70 family RNA polymerase sigma factor [Candidatus Dormibacteria bacterium]
MNADKPTPQGIRDQIIELQPALLRFARSLTRSAADAEDLAQETMARALRFEDHFAPGTDARAWLFTICRRLQQRRWRQDMTRPRDIPITAVDDGEGVQDVALVSPLAVEPAVMRRFERQAVARAFDALSEEHATPLRMYALESLSYQEIANRLEIPVGTVMSRIFRARRNLVRGLLEAGMR